MFKLGPSPIVNFRTRNLLVQLTVNFTSSGANNGLPDVMALMIVEGYVKLVITLGPHPNAPLELYMNRGDRLDDRKWHTVQIIRELKVQKSLLLCSIIPVMIKD